MVGGGCASNVQPSVILSGYCNALSTKDWGYFLLALEGNFPLEHNADFAKS